MTSHGLGAATALQWAVNNQRWDACHLLLRLGRPKVLSSPFIPAGLFAIPLKRVYDLVMEDPEARRDRKLVSLVELAAKKERAEQSAASVAPAREASSAFEDPSVKVLTEKEEKKKAKKRAQKKKAKAKKREKAREEAAGVASAGAGKEQPLSSDDDDSSGTDEEEAGMTEEEKMLARAPTFDLEKEKAARKARAAAEAEEAAKKGKE
jgi:hypothetical protein